VCQVHDPKATKELRKRLKKRGWITAWKVLKRRISWLTSICHYHSWRPGVQVSGRDGKALAPHEQDSGKIFHGYHVYLHRADAEACANPRYDEHVVPTKCRLKHLVGAGTEAGTCKTTAVFTQVELTKRAYRKAMA